MRNEYKTPRAYWDAYVAENGGPKGVSEKLGIPYPTIAGVCNGNRGIGRRLAYRMESADPLLDASRLVWVQASKESVQQPAVGEGAKDAA